MIDSGASEHAINDQSLFQSIDPFDIVTLEQGNEFFAGAVTRGTVLA